jgi:hypothetical protein
LRALQQAAAGQCKGQGGASRHCGSDPAAGQSHSFLHESPRGRQADIDPARPHADIEFPDLPIAAQDASILPEIRPIRGGRVQRFGKPRNRGLRAGRTLEVHGTIRGGAKPRDGHPWAFILGPATTTSVVMLMVKCGLCEASL